MKTVYLNAAYFPSVELLSAVATAAILLYGGNQVLDGDGVTIGVLASFVFYLQSFFDPIQQLSQLYTTYQAGMAALDKIFELLDEEPDLVEAPDAIELPRVRGEIRFEDVSFSYGGGDGRRSARRRPDRAAGPDGGARGRHRRRQVHARQARRALLRPDRGRVLIDGHDLRDVTERSLRSQLGIVPQEGFLFSGTIRDNIAFGRPTPPTRRSSRPRRGRARTSSSSACRRLRHGGRRARRPPLGRPAPAGGFRPRRGGRPAHPDPRRGDLERGRAHRGARSSSGLRRLLAGRTAIVIAHRLRRSAAPGGSWCSTRRESSSRARRGGRGGGGGGGDGEAPHGGGEEAGGVWASSAWRCSSARWT